MSTENETKAEGVHGFVHQLLASQQMGMFGKGSLRFDEICRAACVYSHNFLNCPIGDNDPIAIAAITPEKKSTKKKVS